MKHKFWIFSLIGTIIILFSSCKKDEIVPVKQFPVLTTSTVTNVTKTAATAGGKIYETGYTEITASGVVWDTAHDPTVETHLGISTDGAKDVGEFTSNLTGLHAATAYYVRAYATNSVGTAYGSEKGFLTEAEPITVTDADGNVYHGVTIGAQVWTVENLRTTKYNDGTNIELVTDATWDVLTTGAYCWYNNDISNKDTYGAIYNWFAVETGKLAPAGWHVPTKAEWQVLADNLGGGAVAGGKLKETGATHWNSPNTDATNETGFTGLPGGFRYPGGIGAALGDNALFQTATEEQTNPDAWVYYAILWKDKASLDLPYWTKNAGCSVRLVKDN